MVIDDEPDSARALARLLRFWGHEVEVAHDARAAIEGAADAARGRLPRLGIAGCRWV